MTMQFAFMPLILIPHGLRLIFSAASTKFNVSFSVDVARCRGGHNTSDAAFRVADVKSALYSRRYCRRHLRNTTDISGAATAVGEHASFQRGARAIVWRMARHHDLLLKRGGFDKACRARESAESSADGCELGSQSTAARAAA